ncbi:MAG: phosphatidylserine/phosphatidylglycerophosphate/cardiolipin synthase family protein [Sphaerochaeta sp.]|uniref:phospholipase D-like domain-containing protein n=1 Tax=Sphaerochaeta sp. TaxID=1972642 RepID=UPI003D0DB8E9
MRRFLLLCSLGIVLLFSSCTNTRQMLDPYVLDSQIPLNEKYAAFSIPEVQISTPVVYQDGKAWRDRIKELVEGAQDYIITSSFLASSSAELEDLYAAIVQKAKSGVRVYFVVDGIGAFDMTDTRYHLIPLNFLRDSGVHILEFNPMSGTRLISTVGLAVRDHRKFVIVDGKHLAVGGMNLNYISIGATDDQLQRDSMYEFYSPQLCTIMLDHFVPWWNDRSWETVRREDFSVDQTTLDGLDTYTAWYVDQHPDSKKLSQLYGTMIAQAKTSIEVLPFLPFFDDSMLEAFRKASERGVKIKMVIPFDKRETNRKGIEYMTKQLLTMGIDLRVESEKVRSLGLLHEKLMIIDDRYVLVGSTNVNYRSFNLAYETSLLIDDAALALQLKDHFAALYENTIPITEDMADSWHTIDALPRYLFGFFGG